MTEFGFAHIFTQTMNLILLRFWFRETNRPAESYWNKEERMFADLLLAEYFRSKVYSWSIIA